MEITYNGVSGVNNLVTFDGVYNIVKVKENIGGTKASFSFVFSDNLRSTVTADTQYYVTFLGETVTNVMSPSNATNKRFFIADDNASTASSFCRALRNCPSLAVDFDITHNNGTVTLTSKTIGSKWSNVNNYLIRNIPSTYLSTVGSDGNVYSDLWNSKVNVDIYDGSTYITTLEKNFYGDECAFDVSPVLGTFTEYGKLKPYTLKVSYIGENGRWYQGTEISGSTCSGYQANQSKKMLVRNGILPLLNLRRGESGVILYTYGAFIPFSWLVGDGFGGYTLTYTLRDSAFNEIYTYNDTRQVGWQAPKFIDGGWTIPSEYYERTSYVDVVFGGVETVRFHVIKPLKAAESYQRVLWRNEYGGISFFDFTGGITETDSVDVETYEKNIFDFYESDEFERKKIYDTNVNKKVKLTSHLMEKDGKWIFNSLIKSKSIWTTVNGTVHYIIPTDLSISEDESHNGIYTASLTYEYSELS